MRSFRVRGGERDVVFAQVGTVVLVFDAFHALGEPGREERDADLPNMPPLSARGLEDAVAALETGATVMDPADPTNMAVTAAESGRAL